jgi:hypothetical protein
MGLAVDFSSGYPLCQVITPDAFETQGLAKVFLLP